MRCFRVLAITCSVTFFTHFKGLHANEVQDDTGGSVVANVSVQSQLQRLYKQTSDSIVRVVWGGEYEASLANGVVVTAKGHVVLLNARLPADSKVDGPLAIFGRRIKTGDPLVFYFADGRRVVGVAAGWSEEWNISVAKISDEGPWPHVSLPEHAEVKTGDICVSLGYSRLRGGQYDQKPAMRLGSVTESIPKTWLSCSCVMDRFDGVFSLDGRLLGMTTLKVYGSNPVQTDAAVIAELWPHLIAGENVDRIRLHSSEAIRHIETQSKLKEKKQAQPTERIRLATVRIQGRGTPSWRWWSGIVFRRDGYIATCAHHKHLPGEKVTVQFSDGRDVPAQVLGTNPVSDISLVKISQKGNWPHVELGSSLTLKPNDDCIVSGFPMRRKGREPLIRESKVVEAAGYEWSSTLLTAAATKMHGGDSGGGVFDKQGRLVAVHQGQDEGQVGRHKRIELFRLQWDTLTSTKASIHPENSSAIPNQVSTHGKAVVVSVLADGKQCALGTVVGSDGRIVTKASELRGVTTCRFSDGSEVAAQVERSSREHDLALLKVDVTDLPVAQFDNAIAHFPGLMLSAPIPNQAPHIGVVSLQERSTPVNRGGGFSGLKDTERGLELVDSSWVQQIRLPLRREDIILSVEGYTTPNLSSFTALLNGEGQPPKLAKEGGDRASVSVRRSGEIVNLEFQLPSSNWPRPKEESKRCSGFPTVFDADIRLKSKQCGGPVMDSKGRTVGIVIACRSAGLLHVIPSRVLRQFIADPANDGD